MSDDFYTMVDSGDPTPDNEHINGVREEREEGEQTSKQTPKTMYAARIAVYLHGRAGETLAQTRSLYGVLPSELACAVAGEIAKL